MGWSKDYGTAAKVNAEYAKEQGNVAKQEATNLAELKSNVEAATQNASTAAENANAVIVDANTAASNADSAASEAIAQANHAKNEGDRAKAEADRLAGTDVSVLDNKVTNLSDSVNTKFGEVTTQLAQKAEKGELSSKVEKAYVDTNLATLDTKITAQASGSPKGTYSSLSDLRTAFPTGNSNIYLITTDGNWYYWNNIDWVSGGVYQSQIANAINVNLVGAVGDFNSSNVDGALRELSNGIGGKAKNIIKNGDFKDATVWNDYSPYKPAIVSANNTATITATSTDRVYVGQRNLPDLFQNNKIFIRFIAKGSKAGKINVALTNNVFGEIRASTDLTLSSTNQTFSLVLTPNQDAQGLRINGTDFTIANDSISLSYFLVLNLTQIFGAGNEPSVADVNKILGYYSNSWFNGVVTPFIKNDYIRKALDTEVARLDGTLNQVVSSQISANNIIKNGDFLDRSNWYALSDANSPTFTVQNKTMKVTATATAKVYFGQKDVPNLSIGDKIYVKFNAKANKNGIINVAVSSNNFSIVDSNKNLNIETVNKNYSAVLSITKDSMKAIRINGVDFTVANDYVETSYFLAVNLTESFGRGNEPTVESMDNMLSKYTNSWFNGQVPSLLTQKDLLLETQLLHSEVSSIKDIISGATAESDFELKITTIADKTTGISQTKDISPTLFGVKMTNERNVVTGNPTTPKPIGWLYYTHETPSRLLYSAVVPDNMVEIAKWNSSISYSPLTHSPFITKDGDIIFVYRGELDGSSTPNPNARRNPVIFPAGDYNNPVVVDFGDRIKPTSWLQNCGADYIYHEDCFIFSEYTRLAHEKCYVWKVTKPFTNPDNWRIVKELPVSRDGVVGVEHAHTINYDPFSDKVFYTTGDTDAESKIFMSSDYGETWELKVENSAKNARLLNFIFTKDRVYWASDDYNHYLLSCGRDANGVPDFSNIVDEFNFQGDAPTYVTCLINNPYGLLILNRHDGVYNVSKLNVYFYDLKTRKMHIIDAIYPIGTNNITFGFRCEATNWYHSNSDNRIVCGFGHRQNTMDLLGNMEGSNVDKVNNLALEVVKK